MPESSDVVTELVYLFRDIVGSIFRNFIPLIIGGLAGGAVGFLLGRKIARHRYHSPRSNRHSDAEPIRPQTRPSANQVVTQQSGQQKRPNIVGANSGLVSHPPRDASQTQTPVIQLPSDEPWSIPQTQESNPYEVDSSPYRSEPVARELFFPAPRGDGSFDAKHARPSYKDGESMYKAVLTSANEAQFEIYNQQTVLNKARNTPDACLDPVCDGARDYSRPFQGIQTDVKGTLRLEGDFWVLISKARISYRY